MADISLTPTEAIEVLTSLLPDSGVVQLERISVAANTCLIHMVVSTTQQVAPCPLCDKAATRIYSRYQRKLADLPWAGRPVRIRLQVRRFFCDNRNCQRRIFSERLPTVVAPWARRTQRLADAQQQIGLAVGGVGGARLATALSMPAGVDLMLGLIRCARLPERPPPRILGADDWAQRKGFTYGTILVDLENGWIVDLLADRTAETLASWLREHPGVEVVSRDRAEGYAQGARQGAPQALQVADRFHLLRNLAEVVGKVLQHHHQLIEKEFAPVPGANSAVSSNPTVIAGATAVQTTIASGAVPSVADERRRQQAETAHHLHRQGWTTKAIAQHLGVHPKTISRDLQRGLPLAPLRRTRQRLHDPYLPYLLARWNDGCHNGAQLLRERQAQGFTGRYTIVCAFVGQLRRASGLRPRTRMAGGTKLETDPTRRPLTPRSLT